MFAEDTILLAENGLYKAITDLAVGDKIFGPTGRVLTISSITDQGATPLYRVDSADYWYRVTADHVLNLIAGEDLRHPVTGAELRMGQTFYISIEDYLAQDDGFRAKTFGYRSTLSFPAVDPGFSSYAYGVILSYDHYISRLVKKLRLPELRIPKSYLYNGMDVRRALLAGYVDGCGDVSTGNLRLRIADNLLRSSFMFLARSMGCVAYCTEDDVLEIVGNLNFIPTEILRMPSGGASPFHEIAVSPDGEGTVYSIEIAENYSGVLLSDFSVVHV